MNVKIDSGTLCLELNKWLAGTIVLGMSGWLSYMTYQQSAMALDISNKPTLAQVEKMIEKDGTRAVILNQVLSLQKSVENNTKAMHDLSKEFAGFRGKFDVTPADVLRELRKRESAEL